MISRGVGWGFRSLFERCYFSFKPIVSESTTKNARAAFARAWGESKFVIETGPSRSKPIRELPPRRWRQYRNHPVPLSSESLQSNSTPIQIQMPADLAKYRQAGKAVRPEKQDHGQFGWSIHRLNRFRRYLLFNCVLIWLTSSESSGFVRGGKRLTRLPSRSIRNFSKFQLTFPFPAG